ncbi:hypothetical protein [Mesorhizobium sp. WSM3224]|uniref:hypothetical protein n=1 Tax=Mesorhizobium sp. WSM3224 TaxID=1040986 RepID=UPI0012ECB7BE|nr:hypothetical protein [Mesorhizobium sp. WSM3224]
MHVEIQAKSNAWRRAAVTAISGSWLASTAMAAFAVAGALAGGSQVAYAATAPACIIRKVHPNLENVSVFNYCGRTMRVQVRVSWNFDSPCYTLAHGQSFNFGWGAGDYRKISVC